MNDSSIIQQPAPYRNFVRAILAWYRRHGRSLPWRNISHPYRILVSEFMLQQTQVSRVLEKYPSFLLRFPTLRSLAEAPRREVILAWDGLGYNNRAVRLHECAKTLLHRYRGTLPTSYEELVRLPGIGPYTANALLVSVHRRPVAVVDVNVQRVLSRVFWRMPSLDAVQDASRVAACAFAILPRRRAYDWTQAMMDLGATICLARNPRCGACPVASLCRSRGAMLRSIGRRTSGERTFDGLPNRIYRGRVVTYLRKNKKPCSAIRIARAVRPTFAHSHASWFVALLKKLERDGLIRLYGNGTLKTMRVSLA
ncbi:MAG TPA: A/G-specific adenine glycosylase [Bacteroidota bacterium]|nr:A/G-specific adenine glycosylase [Bacteroidota bacterium]